ncbi:MAG: preprotein translocase subunit SecE [Propionibacteriaceae bacterium]
MAQDKDREPTFGSTPGADDPADQHLDPASGSQDSEQPAERLGGDTEVPGTADDTSDAPASEEGESSEQERQESQDRGHGVPDGDDDGDRELVAVGAPSKQRSTAAGKGTGETKSRNAAAARTKKDKATPKQQLATKPKRTTPAQFVREAVGELRKVVYPTGSQLANYFVVVLVFVLFIIGIVSLLDLGFGWVIFRMFA